MQKICFKHFLLLFSAIFLAVFPVAADDSDAVFERAYEILLDGDYSEAYSILIKLQATYPRHKNADRFQFYKAKAAYYANWFESGIEEAKTLISRYPESKYVPYSYYFAGNAYYRLEQPNQAVRSYLKAYGASSDQKLDFLILSAIESARIDPRSNVLEQIQNVALTDEKKCNILISVAQALSAQKNYRSVEKLLASCTDRRAKALRAQAEKFLKQQVEIGVVLPLSGEWQKFGEQILDGITLRIEKYTSETAGKLTRVLYDSRGENLEAARIIKELSLSGTSAAIGPLTSEETAIASAMLSCGDMPLIFPTASQGGLTELSTTGFQLQPNLEWQGIRMADFAIEYLKADTAAVITPTSPENLRMTRAFTKRFEKLGGTILGVERFRVRDTDFGPYVRDVKSLIIGELLDSIIFISDDGDTIEAEEVPVWIDCLYIPARAEQLRQLLPQISFYNLNTTYLGGDGWGSKMVYRLGERVTGKCYFSSGNINDGIGEEYVKFVTDFDLRYGRQPGRLEAWGYDAMSLLCSAFQSGNYSRSEIAQYLRNVKKYPGVSGDVSFGENRENIELPIYTIENGEPKRVNLMIPNVPDSALVE